MKPQKPVGSEDTGACGWDTARFDTSIRCVQYGAAGDVISAGDSAGRIHFICAQTGKKLLCPLQRRVDGEVKSVVWSPCGEKTAAACNVQMGLMKCSYSVQIFTEEGSAGTFVCQSTLNVGSNVKSVQFSPGGL